MIKQASEYTKSDLIELKKIHEEIPTYLGIDKETCEFVKSILTKHGFIVKYDRGGKNKMFFQFKKFDINIQLLNDDFTSEGFYFVTLYRDIYTFDKSIQKVDPEILDIQFFYDLMQSYIWKNRSFSPDDMGDLEIHKKFPYKGKVITTTYDYIWDHGITDELEKQNLNQEELKIMNNSWKEVLKEVAEQVMENMVNIYKRLDAIK